MEIERKFLINNNFSFDMLEDCKYFNIEQFYLSFEPEIRMRYKEGETVECFLTYKTQGGLIREEVESDIPLNTYLKFKEYRLGRIISKRRYELKLNETLIAEVDFYENDLHGLRVVEVEFSSIEEAKKFDNIKPVWFGKEITENLKYKNVNLALNY